MSHKFTRYHFRGQKEGEEILLVLHRHWFNIITNFFSIFLMLILFFGSYSLSFIFPDFFNDPELKILIVFLRNLLFTFLWMIFFVIWIDYYFDVWIITKERVINIEQKGLFSRVVSELKIRKIQDVTTDVRGVIPTFLNYGDVFVQTAAEQERFRFIKVPDPYAVKDLLMNLQKRIRAQEEKNLGRMIRDELDEN